MARRFDHQLGLVCTGAAALRRLDELGLNRFELVVMDRESEPAAREAAARVETRFGIHAPLFRDVEYPEPALKACLVDPDPERRARAIAFAYAELEQAAAWGAEYLLVHLQRAVLMNRELVPSGWGEREGLQIAIDAIEPLAERANGLGIGLHMENIMASPIFFSPEAHIALCEAVPGVRLCMDLGHLALDATHFGFDLLEAVAALAPFSATMHLYNNQLDDEVEYPDLRESGKLAKFPVHPSQSPGHGWLPVGKALRGALRKNPDLVLMSEVYFRLESSHQQTLEGLEWVAQILDDSRATVL